MHSIRELSAGVTARAVEWRRHLHQHPELAYQEDNTAAFVASQLGEFGLSVHRGLGKTGVVGTLKRGHGKRTVAIRADMDALRIPEESGVPHASRTSGLMHACGHDGHVAIALAAAKVCAQLPDLDGTVHFIFQPAEEGLAGARRMIEEGLFRQFPCDAVYALHNWPSLPVGTCAAMNGPMMAANAVFDVEVSGRGCHAAMPHQGTDVILAASQLVSTLQSIVSRTVNPLDSGVLSVTQIHGGDTHNVMPARCSVRGTARWFDNAVGDNIEQGIARCAQAIAAAFSCEAQFKFERRYPATINDAKVASFVRDLVNSSALDLTVRDEKPSMASEDFAFMLAEVPGCYLWLGAGSDYGLHSPRYDFNDEILTRGIALWATLVQRSLAAE